MVRAGWIAEGEREELVRKARVTATEYEVKGEPELRVLNLGEGWRSIAKAVLKHYPTARVVGVDKRGFTWTGYQEGYITAEIMHDWNQQSSAAGSDLITAVSKKAAVPVGAWDVIDLEPECTLFSTADTQNTSRGCTHGKYLDTPAILMSHPVFHRQVTKKLLD